MEVFESKVVSGTIESNFGSSQDISDKFSPIKDSQKRIGLPSWNGKMPRRRCGT